MRLRHRAFSYVGALFLVYCVVDKSAYRVQRAEAFKNERLQFIRENRFIFVCKARSTAYGFSILPAVKQGRDLAFFSLVEVALKGKNLLLVKCTDKPGKRFGVGIYRISEPLH